MLHPSNANHPIHRFIIREKKKTNVYDILRKHSYNLNILRKMFRTKLPSYE